ncbi:methyl-accepting chemotaxis protein [Dactylosporangium sp. CA-139114]|uniref:methyl-accepting chemotaxis protein n=1 Tax=Dactylosporangium sp. CA-139114 TaxID=3239931 RepID=UPI003D99C3F5
MAEVWYVIVALLVGLGIGFAAGRRRPAPPPSPGPAPDAFRRGVGEFAEAVAPVWSAQIESSRAQMEAGIGAVTQQFSQIVDNVDAVLASSADALGPHGGGAGSFDRGRERLGNVVHILDNAMRAKRQAVHDLAGLAGFNDELRQMTADVAQIAAQTNLLALNASIEAARVGAAGAGFGVVALEVRRLADRSLQTSEQMAEKVGGIGSAIAGVLAGAEGDAERESVAVARAHDDVQEVIDDLQEVVNRSRESSQRLERAAVEIRSSISDAIVSLQFQDRVGQVLQHLEDNIKSLPRHVAEAPDAGPRAQKLLAELEHTYTMQGELQAHRAGAVTEAPTSEITFF